jgi:predicted ATPase
MARIEMIQIKNFRVLRDVKFGSSDSPLEPFTVFLGPNGSGKTTLFRVFGFLSNALQGNIRNALNGEGGFKEVRSRESTGPISIEIKYRDKPDSPRVTYNLEINEENGKPIISKEMLMFRRGSYGRPYKFLDFSRGEGTAIRGTGEILEEGRTLQKLDSPDILAVKGLGQMADYPIIADFRRFIEGWYLSYFMPTKAREIPEAGIVAEHLSQSGDNLPLVTQYLYEQHQDIFKDILKRLAERIPGLEDVFADITDGRVVLKFKDGPFKDPFVSRFVSDGTIKMFAYLVLLNDPEPPPLLCIEEPENQLHPRLLPVLAEEFRAHSRKTQVFVTSHSPYFLNALRPEELWVLQRGTDGYTKAECAAKIQGVPEFFEQDLKLGELWFSGHLRGGNP